MIVTCPGFGRDIPCPILIRYARCCFLRTGSHIWLFPKIVVPQNGWFISENPIKMGWFGGTYPYFLETPIYVIVIIMAKMELSPKFFWDLKTGGFGVWRFQNPRNLQRSDPRFHGPLKSTWVSNRSKSQLTERGVRWDLGPIQFVH